MVWPSGRAQFNVPIRSAVIDRARGTAVCHVGSGVVWDSEAAAEFEECRLKARVLSAPPTPPFQLLESLLWTPGEGYALRPEHLRRLADSAEYFGYALDLSATERRPDGLSHGMTPASKGRLLVGPGGGGAVEARPAAAGAAAAPPRTGVAGGAGQSGGQWVY